MLLGVSCNRLKIAFQNKVSCYFGFFVLKVEDIVINRIFENGLSITIS